MPDRCEYVAAGTLGGIMGSVLAYLLVLSGDIAIERDNPYRGIFHTCIYLACILASAGSFLTAIHTRDEEEDFRNHNSERDTQQLLQEQQNQAEEDERLEHITKENNSLKEMLMDRTITPVDFNPMLLTGAELQLYSTIVGKIKNTHLQQTLQHRLKDYLSHLSKHEEYLKLGCVLSTETIKDIANPLTIVGNNFQHTYDYNSYLNHISYCTNEFKRQAYVPENRAILFGNKTLKFYRGFPPIQFVQDARKMLEVEQRKSLASFHGLFKPDVVITIDRIKTEPETSLIHSLTSR